VRLWSLHPKYLDRLGLVAVWREALLAKAVLNGKTEGYRHHPQLQRFRNYSEPSLAISYYLSQIHIEANDRKYNFDGTKYDVVANPEIIPVTQGQMEFETAHLLQKVQKRSPPIFRKLRGLPAIEPHPLFRIVPGEIEKWEKGTVSKLAMT
jgi:hypothetical protein